MSGCRTTRRGGSWWTPQPSTTSWILAGLVAILGIAHYAPLQRALADEEGSPSATLTVSVADAQGDPVSGIRVGLRRATESAWSLKDTDTEGRVTFFGCSPGRHVCGVVGDKFVPPLPKSQEKRVDLRTGASRALKLTVDLRTVLRVLIPGARERRELFEARGTAAVMQFFLLDGETLVATVFEDPRGAETQIVNLKAGKRYDLLARQVDGSLQALLLGVTGGPRRLTLKPSAGLSIEGRLSPTRPGVAYRAVFRGAVLMLKPDDRGRFTIDGLPKGARVALEAFGVVQGRSFRRTKPVTAGSRGVVWDLR